MTTGTSAKVADAGVLAKFRQPLENLPNLRLGFGSPLLLRLGHSGISIRHQLRRSVDHRPICGEVVQLLLAEHDGYPFAALWQMPKPGCNLFRARRRTRPVGEESRVCDAGILRDGPFNIGKERYPRKNFFAQPRATARYFRCKCMSERRRLKRLNREGVGRDDAPCVVIREAPHCMQKSAGYSAPAIRLVYDELHYERNTAPRGVQLLVNRLRHKPVAVPAQRNAVVVRRIRALVVSRP